MMMFGRNAKGGSDERQGTDTGRKMLLDRMNGGLNDGQSET